MSRSNVDDVVFVAGMGARGAAVGLMVYAIVRLSRRIWDELAFEAAWKYPGE